jgi:molybdopterin-guanine dinucleotide biosynthesis protein A
MIDWGAAFVDFADDAPFANVNTPDDLSALSPV